MIASASAVPPRTAHPSTWLALVVLGWLVVLGHELAHQAFSATLAGHEIAAVRSSLVTGITVAVTIAVPSALLAYPLARSVSAPWLLGLALVSPLARAYGSLALGLTPGFGASVLAGVGEAIPIAALLVGLVLRGRPLAWLEAAADLGASRWARWWRVEWPCVRVAVGVAAVWVGLRALGDAVIPEVAGGGKLYTPGLLLRDAINSDGAPPRAAALVMAQLVTGFAIAWWATGHQLTGAWMGRERGALPTGRGLRAASVVGVLLCIATPGALVPALTLAWGRADDLVLQQFPVTIGLALATAVVAAIAALAAADPRMPPRVVRALLFVPLALPPSLVGLGTLAVAAAYGFGPSYTLTLVALVPWAVALGSTSGWLLRGRLPARLFEAAADLGASPWQRFVRIRLPLAIPAMLAAGVLAFAWVVADRAITGFTTPPGGGTVAATLAAIVHGGAWAAAVRWLVLLAAVPLGLVALTKILLRRAEP